MTGIEKRKTLISYSAAFLLFTAAVILDQITKYLAVHFLKDAAPCVLVEGVFQLRYLENRGAAFGMMQNMQYVFVAGAVLIVLAFAVIYGKIPHRKRYIPLRVCGVFLCAGAVGNMIDRLRLNYVIDFFYFNLIDFPIFNVADCYVVVSCIAFVLLILFYYKDEDDFSFLKKKADRNKQ